VSDRLIESDKPTTAKSTESRTVGFEVQISKDARGTVVVPIFGLYHVCDDAQGQCRYLRLDTKVDVKVK
jgi:hypothetical protein